jgi:tetratricopeptide (TPR) repeat protein
MKNIYLILILFLGFIEAKAQKVDLDRLGFSHNYRRLPNQALDKSFTTFSVEINKTTALNAFSNETAPERVEIEGKDRVSADGHLRININLGDLMIESTDIKERVEVIKDKEGKETGKKYYYAAQVVYSFDASAAVTDVDGKALNRYTFARRSDKLNWSSSEYSSRTAAADFYNNNKLEIKTTLISNHINGALKELNDKLNNEYGYRSMSVREILWELDSKKHPEYVAYNEACKAIKSALETIQTDELKAEETIESLKPHIDYLNTLQAQYNNPKDKGHKKLVFGAYWNLASLYLYTEQFEQAKDYANKIIANEYDKKDGERMLKEIDSIQANFNKHSIYTRHFSPEAIRTTVAK